MLLLLFC